MREPVHFFSGCLGIKKRVFDSTLLANDTFLILEPSVVNNKKDFLTHKYKALALGFKNT